MLKSMAHLIPGLCVCENHIVFITLEQLDPPLLLTAHTSSPFCNHITTHTPLTHAHISTGVDEVLLPLFQR